MYVALLSAGVHGIAWVKKIPYGVGKCNLPHTKAITKVIWYKVHQLYEPKGIPNGR